MSEEASVRLAVPDIGVRERELVVEALDSGFVSSVGPFVAEFEQRFAREIGSRFAVACSSGTAAIHLALRVLGVGQGDVVALSDFTFIGSANPVLYLGASPLFVDSEMTTWNMDPQLLEDELARRACNGQPLPKVVEVVHALGQPAQLADIGQVCGRYDIPIIEDAAEALGAGWSDGPLSGQRVGSVGKVAMFSFNGNKIATTGGGGMLVTDDEDTATRTRHLSTQAKVQGVGYLHDEVGYNYRLTNIAAAIGLAQLERLPEFVSAKRAIARRYDSAFANLPMVLPPRVMGLDSTYWLYSVLVPKGARDPLLAHLARKNVEARPLWRPLHVQPIFGAHGSVGGATGEDLFERGVSLPCSTGLDPASQHKVIESVTEFFDQGSSE